jgi:hypothetical protein
MSEYMFQVFTLGELKFDNKWFCILAVYCHLIFKTERPICPRDNWGGNSIDLFQCMVDLHSYFQNYLVASRKGSFIAN